MHSDKKTLKIGSRAFDLVKQLEDVIAEFVQRDPQQKLEIISRLQELEAIFKPYYDVLQRREEDVKKHELEIKRICADQGHIGEWSEITGYKEVWIGDLPGMQLVTIPYSAWERKCTRCGELEVLKTEPEEVIRNRKIKEIEELENKIKKMKSEL